MPARTGQEYITGLKERPREVWLNGERIEDVTTHPALCNGVRSVAALYDMQHDPALREEMTFASPTTGEPVGLSFLIPKTTDDLVRRREMMTRWAWASCGMMGRSPDFMNSIFTAWAGSAGYFAQDRPEFKKNMVNYHEFIREKDVTLTHALVNLQRRRHQGPTDILNEDVALTMVKETDAGHRRQGQPDAGDAGANIRRNSNLPRGESQAGRRSEAADVLLLHPLRHAGNQVPVPGELRFRPLPLQSSPRLPIRGDGLGGVFRRRPGAVGTRLPAG